MGEPARGYSWAPFTTDNHPLGQPFESGNQASLRHGTYSPRVIDPLAAELVEHITATADWLRPCDTLSVWALARAEAGIQLLVEYLADGGVGLSGDGEELAAAKRLSRLEARAESLRSKLGLDPLSRARLGRDVATTQVDLARMWQLQDEAEAVAEKGGDDGVVA